MQENMTSEEALQQPDELTEMFVQRRKTASLWDIVTVQLLLCVLLAVGFAAVNIMNGGLAADIYDAYKRSFASETDFSEIFAAISAYLSNV